MPDIRGIIEGILVSVFVLFILYANDYTFEKRKQVNNEQQEIINQSIISELEDCRKGKYDRIVSIYKCKPRKDGWALIKPLEEVRR